MADRKFATILGIYGKPSDRFMAGGYKPVAPDVFTRIQQAADDDLVQGVELIQGDGGDINHGNYKAVYSALQDAGLVLCAVNPDLWGEPQWYKGTLGSANPKIFNLALDRIKSAMDLAAELNCDYVGLWPGQDGYDYLFEVDYLKIYEQWVKGMQILADHNPTVRLGIEYKPYEPRTHSTIDSGPKTLLMLKDIDRTNVGLTLDIGHAMVNHENLGEIIALSQRQDKLFHLHLNDNYTDWDWDLNFASVHLFDFIEMAYWLKRTNYQGWYSIDIFSYRLDASESIHESLAWLESILKFVDEVGTDEFNQLIASGDPLAISKFLRTQVFSPK